MTKLAAVVISALAALGFSASVGTFAQAAAPAAPQEQSETVRSATLLTLHGKITEVNKAKKQLTLEAPNGRRVIVTVENPYNLEAVHVGDPVVVRYYEVVTRPRSLEYFRDEVIVPILRLFVAARLLPVRELYLLPLHILVLNKAQQMRNTVEARSPFVVGVDDVPWSIRGIGSQQHLIASTRIVIPLPMRFQVHRTEFPNLATIGDSRLKAPGLLVLADFKPIFDKRDAGVDDRPLPNRAELQESGRFFLRAESHHALYAGAIVTNCDRR